MLTPETFFYWRLANAVLGTIGFTWLLMRVNHQWPRLNAERRAGNAVLLLFTFATVYGSSEAARTQSPPGARTGVYSLALLALLLHLTILTVRAHRRRKANARG